MEVLYKGRLIQLEQKESRDKTTMLEIAHRPPGVRLIIPTVDGLRLNYEFRQSLGRYDYRLPGGKVFDTWNEYENFCKKFSTEKDLKRALLEESKIAAIKEGLEEQGIIINDLDFFRLSPCGTVMKWDLYYFVVKDFSITEQQLEHDEQIDVAEKSFEEVLKVCFSEEFSEDRSLAVLFRYLKKVNVIKL